MPWILVVLVAVLLVGCQAPHPSASAFEAAAKELPTAEAAAKTAGLAFTVEELYPPVPPEEDASPELRPLLESLEEPISPMRAKKPAVSEATVEKIIAATAKPKFGFQIKNGEADWARVSLLRKGAVAIRDGFRADPKPAPAKVERGIRAIFRLATYADQEQSVIALLVRASLDAVALTTAETALQKNPAPEMIASLRATLKQMPPINLREAFRFELVLGMTATAGDRLKDEEPLFGDEKPTPNPLRLPGIDEKTLVRAYRTRMLQAYTEFFTVTKPGESFSQTITQLRAVERKWGRADDPTHSMNRTQFAAYENLEELQLRRDSKSGLMEAFLRVLEFRNRTGKLPKDLAEAGVSATDAFHQGRAFEYVVDGGYFRVASAKNLVLEWPENRVKKENP